MSEAILIWDELKARGVVKWDAGIAEHGGELSRDLPPMRRPKKAKVTP